MIVSAAVLQLLILIIDPFADDDLVGKIERSSFTSLNSPVGINPLSTGRNLEAGYE